MVYVVIALVVAVVLDIVLMLTMVSMASRFNEQKKTMSNLENSAKKWMDSAEWFKKTSEKHALDLGKAYDEIVATSEVLDTVKESLSKERSRNKSVEVRTGLIMEKMAPFFEVFDHDPKNAQFLGNPIDYIIFNDEEIVFLEVKTGKARTTKKQNDIKKLVEAGKVKFELVRFDYE